MVIAGFRLGICEGLSDGSVLGSSGGQEQAPIQASSTYGIIVLSARDTGLLQDHSHSVGSVDTRM